MKVAKEMNKKDMIIIMIDNNYPDAWSYLPSWMRRKRSEQECYTWVLNYLLYHVLKEDVYKMFKDYLYWKIEKNN